MKILAMKLITGEDILAEVDTESEVEFILVNPVGIAVVRGRDGTPNVGFAPFPLHSEQNTGATIAIAKKHVVYSYVPAEDFINNYNQIFGSGIVLPNKQIITG
jgi:alpha-D-ribose 1-methylphosphonate 5-triphosphate synthase subunit PhnG